ncbi:solute carrier family 2, facilitated glucose transporter member 5-like [Trichosurus vulpecula]|uniref:solute carrier family 2, facilitated glucose transporter member 5-like n=1 Tax=Trichosurus vulpecula TaxID=9337 RepID=UPI00186AC73A|nr:solute carrier family 2, facilitated glucose transporter member 5-like [Trichosurus vulpecula]
MGHYKLSSGKRLTLSLAMASLVAAFGSSFQYGYNVAVVNSPSEILKHFYNETYYDRTSKYMSSSYVTLLWSVTVSMFPLGGLIGSLIVGPMVNKFGRKGTLLINNIFSIVPAILMGCSKVAKSCEVIIFARIVVGICAGLSSSVVPMYLGELAPQNLRGAIGVVPQLLITFGIFAAQVFGFRSILATEDGWTILLALKAIPASLQVILLPFFPESPRYILIQTGGEEGAGKALKTLRNSENIEDEVEEILMEHEVEKAADIMSVVKIFSTNSLRWQFISIIVLMAGQQFSGVNAVYYYATQIYRTAGVVEYNIQYITAGTGAVNVVMTVVAVFIVELLGRRLLLITGFGTCFPACVVLTVALSLQNTVKRMPFLSIVCVITYIIGHAIGPSPIPSLIIAEIFLQSSQPAAFMLGGTIHWLSMFAVGLLFPLIRKGLGAFSFLIFAGVCLFTALYSYYIIPETKSKTFVEINQIFAKINKMSEIQPEKEKSSSFYPPTIP